MDHGRDEAPHDIDAGAAVDPDDARGQAPETETEHHDEPDVCALDGCESPVPAPALDEHGRRRGGRPPAYCGKAHADVASRQRRSRDAAAVDDPLREVRAIGERVLPAAGELAAALARLQERFDAAESGALGQVKQAQAEAARAQRDSELAVRRAERAERRRGEALAQTREHQEAKARAEREERAAEESRTQAWDEVARHEYVRGQAEAARQAAEDARDELARQLRAVREEAAALRAAHGEAAETLAETNRTLAEATMAKSVLEAQLRAAGERAETAEAARDAARGDANRTRDEIAATRDALDQRTRELAEERAARQVAEARGGDVRQALARAEQRADTADAQLRELTARLATRGTDPTDTDRPEP